MHRYSQKIQGRGQLVTDGNPEDEKNKGKSVENMSRAERIDGFSRRLHSIEDRLDSLKIKLSNKKNEILASKEKERKPFKEENILEGEPQENRRRKSPPQLSHGRRRNQKDQIGGNKQKKVNEEKKWKKFNLCQLQGTLEQQRQKNKNIVRKRKRGVQAYFIGPKAENIQYLKQLIFQGLDSHAWARTSYVMDDKKHITREIKESPSFLQARDALARGYSYMLTKLRDLSPPFYTARYYGHMNWDVTIPSAIGYFSTMLYNPNNCAFQASAFTTQLEIDCMKQFAEMFGYPPMLTGLNEQSGINYSWGHFTCGGTVANSEAFWAARSVKFLSFGLRKFIKSLPTESFDKVKDVQVRLATGESKKLLETTVWEVINVPNDDAMILNEDVFSLVYDDDPNRYSEFQDAFAPFTLGKSGFIELFNSLEEDNVANPDPKWPNNKVPSTISFYSATGHYSMPKAVSVLGMGEGKIEKIEVDLDTRIDLVKLEDRLNECNDNHIPVLVVVGIVGTTQESSVDNLVEILNIKDRMAAKGLFFHFHIDGAYGSYFVSMMKNRQSGQMNSLSPYVEEQLNQFYRSDSITFDPHKTGYVPYACGGVFYRNYQLRNNLTFSAPYIFSGFEPNVAIYGIEGSKPGAAVAAVYLSLEVMPLERSGHGELLERTMMNTKIFTCSLYGMQDTTFKFNINGTLYEQKFKCCVLPRTYVEKHNTPEEQAAQDAAYKKIATTKVTEMQSVVEDPAVSKYYYEVGPDLNIVCYCVNFIDKDTGSWCTSLAKIKKFNETVVYLSKPVGTDVSVRCKDLYVSETTIGKTYGNDLVNDFLSRNNITKDTDSIEFIRSTIMNPFFTEQPNENPNTLFINELAENCCEALDYLSKNGWK